MTIHTEPETRRHGFESDKKTFLVTLFSLIVLVFLCLFSFIYFVFFFFSFYILCLSSNIDYIIIYFLFSGCICLRICFISFCPRTVCDNYDGWGLSSVAMFRVPVSTIISSFFSKCRFKSKTVHLRTIKKIEQQRYPPLFSNHRIHCTTLSWLYTFYVEVFLLPFITTKFTTVNVRNLLQGRVFISLQCQCPMLAVYL